MAERIRTLNRQVMNRPTRSLVVTLGPRHDKPWWWKHLDIGSKCELDYRRISMGDVKSAQASPAQAFTLALRLLPLVLGSGKRYDYIFTFECDLTSFIISFIQRLTLSRRPRHIILQFIMRERQASIASRLKYIFMRFCFSSTHMIVCSSRPEARYYKEAFGWSDERVCFAPMHTDPALLDRARDDSAPESDLYIISAGRTFRDYKTLVSAVDGLDIRTVIIASPKNMDIGGMPSNVSFRFDIPLKELDDIVAGSALVVLPLEDKRISTGQSVLLQAMALGKPVIATRTSGTVDYLEHMVNGVLVEPGDPLELRAAIKTLIQDNNLRRIIGENARETVLGKHLPQHYYGNISKIVNRYPDPSDRVT